MKEILFYEYAKCSTCQKAKKWLRSKNVTFKTVPIVENPPNITELLDYIERSGLEIKKFFNTSGEAYRALKLSSKLSQLSKQEAVNLLATNGKLIKRPLLVSNTTVLVGFNEDDYKNAGL